MPGFYWFELRIEGFIYLILYKGKFYFDYYTYCDWCDGKLSSLSFTAFLLGGILENIYCYFPPFVVWIYFFLFEGDYESIWDGENILSVWFICFCWFSPPLYTISILSDGTILWFLIGIGGYAFEITPKDVWFFD